MKSTYPAITQIIRLKNKAQQPVRAVKLELLSSEARDEILSAGEISVMHMKMKVVEYYSQANVLICSNCFGIGHFRKNCPQKEESTCKTCGEKCANLNDHQCSGVLKCIHCGGSHVSNDTKCKVVRDYRAALTRNLLTNPTSTNTNDPMSRPSFIPNNPSSITMVARQPYVTTDTMIPINANEVIFKKLDSILAKVEEESAATRRSLEEVKEEMRIKYDETKQQVDILENKVKNIEKNVEDFVKLIGTTVQNVCTSLFDPSGSQSTNWKSYWQTQIKAMEEFRFSFSKST